MEDMIFIVLFVAVPTILLTVGFIAVLTREKEELQKDHPNEDPRRRGSKI